MVAVYVPFGLVYCAVQWGKGAIRDAPDWPHRATQKAQELAQRARHFAESPHAPEVAGAVGLVIGITALVFLCKAIVPRAAEITPELGANTTLALQTASLVATAFTNTTGAPTL
jgi:hypothetical protein